MKHLIVFLAFISLDFSSLFSCCCSRVSDYAIGDTTVPPQESASSKKTIEMCYSRVVSRLKTIPDLQTNSSFLYGISCIFHAYKRNYLPSAG
ncbi:MAG: hypothetical protein ACK4V2_00930 [Pseudomonadota bacterium]|jgi:hypothetical protein|nr:hypothetical protein [Alphaproteobacteria bacterium]